MNYTHFSNVADVLVYSIYLHRHPFRRRNFSFVTHGLINPLLGDHLSDRHFSSVVGLILTPLHCHRHLSSSLDSILFLLSMISSYLLEDPGPASTARSSRYAEIPFIHPVVPLFLFFSQKKNLS